MKCFESCFKRRSLSRRHFTEETTRRLNQKVFNNEHLSSFDPQNLIFIKSEWLWWFSIWLAVFLLCTLSTFTAVQTKYSYSAARCVNHTISCHRCVLVRIWGILGMWVKLSQSEVKLLSAVSRSRGAERGPLKAAGSSRYRIMFCLLSVCLWVRAEEDERPPSPSQCVYCSFVNESFRQTRSSECTTSQETTFISVGKIHPVVFSSSTDWNTRTSSAAANK